MTEPLRGDSARTEALLVAPLVSMSSPIAKGDGSLMVEEMPVFKDSATRLTLSHRTWSLVPASCAARLRPAACRLRVWPGCNSAK